MNKIMPMSQVRQKITSILNELEKGGEPVIITQRSKVKAVVMSAAEYESLKETLETLSDPAAMAAIKESEKDIRARRLVTLEDLRANYC